MKYSDIKHVKLHESQLQFCAAWVLYKKPKNNWETGSLGCGVEHWHSFGSIFRKSYLFVLDRYGPQGFSCGMLYDNESETVQAATKATNISWNKKYKHSVPFCFLDLESWMYNKRYILQAFDWRKNARMTERKV